MPASLSGAYSVPCNCMAKDIHTYSLSACHAMEYDGWVRTFWRNVLYLRLQFGMLACVYRIVWCHVRTTCVCDTDGIVW